jgi:hypothetical protein
MKEKKFRDYPLTIRMSRDLGARLQAAADAMECDMGAFVRGLMIKHLSELESDKHSETAMHAG